MENKKYKQRQIKQAQTAFLASMESIEKELIEIKINQHRRHNTGSVHSTISET